jgi:hypothetical protein
MGKSPNTTRNSVLFHYCILPSLLLNENTNLEQHHRWIWPFISIVVDVQWKIHARLHFHSCANGGPNNIMVELDKIYVCFYQILKKTNN